MNLAIDILRWIHIPFGFAGLALFWIPLILKKGSRWHRRIGWVFVVCMSVASVTAALLSILRLIQAAQRPEPLTLAAASGPIFLFNVSILTLMSVHSGVATLREKKRTGRSSNALSILMAGALVALSLGSLAIAVIGRAPVMFTLPSVGLIVGGQALWSLLTAPTDRMFWWYQHMAGMLGGCIAAITATLITNARYITPHVPVPMWTLWIAPSALGVPLLIVWIRHYRVKFSRTHDGGRHDRGKGETGDRDTAEA